MRITNTLTICLRRKCTSRVASRSRTVATTVAAALPLEAVVIVVPVQAFAARPGAACRIRFLPSCTLSSMKWKGTMCWMPHGRCFVVKDPTEFVKEYMPTYFNQHKFASFQRQINLYGFKRLTGNTPDKGAYYHGT